MPYSKRYGSIEEIGEKTDNRCHICHEEAHPEDYGSSAGYLGGQATNVDHIVPQSEGGGDEPENLLIAHASCNSSRGTEPVEIARLRHAGTMSKPLSSKGEKALARRRTARAVGIGALVVVGVTVVGGLLWKLFKPKGKTRGEGVAKSPDPNAGQRTQNDENEMDITISRSSFERGLEAYFEARGTPKSARERLLAQLGDAMLVVVELHGERKHEVEIPGWDRELGCEGHISVHAEIEVDGLALFVSSPDPDRQAQSEARAEVIGRRPLFSQGEERA